MFGSIFIGLSGLQAYSKGLQTVSNNVSNMNTQGFKGADVSFQGIYGVGSQGGLEFGNDQQGSGHGVSLSGISTNFAQGELRQTSRDLDLAIDGNGFFVLLDGTDQLFARTGSFEVNNEGFIVLKGTDYKLAVLDEQGRPVPLNIDSKRTNTPEPTRRVTFADNLSSTATAFSIPDVKVYGSDGTEHVWTIAFSRAEIANGKWTVTVTDAAGKQVGVQELEFSGGQIAPGAGELTFKDEEAGLEVVFDFSSGVTSFSSGTVSSLRAKEVDGHATGSLTSLTVSAKGRFEIKYSNDEREELQAIAVADFRDPQSLEQRGNALFAFSGYGQHQFLGAEDTRVGTILSRRLEASNVDLGAQFGDLILIQRGFQASSQIISVTNDMIQQLFGIRGQG